MRGITLEELLEAGCHFGHQVTRQNPKARDFVFEERDNIHIIDLAKTKSGLEEASDFVKTLASKGGTLVVVGTKRQAKGIVEQEIKRAFDQNSEGLFFVINRWIGGTLTNFSEVGKNYKKLKDIVVRLQNEEEKAKYTKKEVGLWEKERQKLEGFYGGIAEIKKLPDALFVIDTHFEELAVKEAAKMGVKIIGIVDTNADPTLVDYPIPANDDAVGSLKLIISYIMDAWIEGKKEGITKEELRIKEEVVEKEPEKEKVKPKTEKKVKREAKSKAKK